MTKQGTSLRLHEGVYSLEDLERTWTTDIKNKSGQKPGKSSKDKRESREIAMLDLLVR